MTIAEIFEKISAHQIEGIMFHNDMSNYYDFLDLKGYKRMHEYHYLCESKELRKTHRYVINHYNKMIKNVPVNSESHIPSIWFEYTRVDVSSDSKKEAIKSSMEKWINWERITKELYNNLYFEAMRLEDLSAAKYICKLYKDVNKELKYAERLHICLKSIDFNLESITESQHDLHERYKKKVGVEI